MAHTLRVSEQPQKRLRGRPRKREEDGTKMMAFRVPYAVWAEARVWLKDGEKTAVVVACLKRAIIRKKQEKGGAE